MRTHTRRPDIWVHGGDPRRRPALARDVDPWAAGVSDAVALQVLARCTFATKEERETLKQVFTRADVFAALDRGKDAFARYFDSSFAPIKRDRRT